jgi:hypothetical protein
VYRDGWRWSYSVQRWLELELQYTEMVGVGATVFRDGWSWSYDVQRWLDFRFRHTKFASATFYRDCCSYNIQWLELRYTDNIDGWVIATANRDDWSYFLPRWFEVLALEKGWMRRS